MSNDELMQFSNLIGLIYEGATDPSRWTKDILPAVADYIQAPECILHTAMHTPQNGGYFFLHGITPMTSGRAPALRETCLSRAP